LRRDNAGPYTAAATLETTQKLKFELLPHPAYSPDIAPSDYHISEPVRDGLRGRQFANDEEVKAVERTWLRLRPKRRSQMALHQEARGEARGLR